MLGVGVAGFVANGHAGRVHLASCSELNSAREVAFSVEFQNGSLRLLALHQAHVTAVCFMLVSLLCVAVATTGSTGTLIPVWCWRVAMPACILRDWPPAGPLFCIASSRFLAASYQR